MNPTRTLILAWGNPGRRDDGLGPALAARVEQLGIAGVVVETDYQLQIEHAADLVDFDRVVFVDAARAGREPFSLERVEAAPDALRYTSHEMSPTAVLALCGELSGARPEGWLLGIRGYEFDEFGEEISPRAGVNLERAVAHLGEALAGDRFATPAVRATNRGVQDQREGEA